MGRTHVDVIWSCLWGVLEIALFTNWQIALKTRFKDPRLPKLQGLGPDHPKTSAV